MLRNRQLIAQMTRREVVGRYQGSVLGLAWSLFHPVLMLVVYTFVFSTVLGMRWGGAADTDHGRFALVLFTGLIVHGLFAECVSRAPGLIVGNANYVKKVVFPLEILPLVAFGSGLFHFVVSLAVLLVAHLVLVGLPPWTLVLLPLVLAPLVLVTLGLSWLLAALGVYLRDIAQIVGVLMSVLLFLSPVFYPISAVPQAYRSLILLNPLTLIIESARDVTLWGRLPDFTSLGLYTVCALLGAWAGWWVFQRSRNGFADVL